MSEVKKAITLQQRFGFQDRELTTPKHDAIMLWLDEHVDAFMRKRFEGTDYAGKWGTSAKAELRRYLERRQGEQAKRERDFNWRSNMWKSGDRVEEGCFYDGYIRAKNALEEVNSWPKLETEALPSFPGLRIDKTWESPVMNGKFMIGFIDMKVAVFNPVPEILSTTWRTEFLLAPSPALFEVKPSIPSLGEVVRQIRMYQEFEDGPFFVVSPDDRFRLQLEAQRIGFLRCPSF